MDAKYVIQSCLLSTRWRHVWRSLPHLTFDRRHFSRLPDFTRFVSQFLTNRSHQSDISVLNLNCDWGKIEYSLVRNIALYAGLHNAQKLNISSSIVSSKGNRQLRLSVFNSGSLKELCLRTTDLVATNIHHRSSWNLGALTTLVFDGVCFVSFYNDGSRKSIDLFSNLSNLRHLTLTDCRTLNSNALNIISPRLETLTISCSYWRDAQCELVVSAPYLSSFNYNVFNPYLSHSISSDGFPCLERVKIHVHNYRLKEKVIRKIIGLFHQLRNAMFLTLTMDTICVLSSVPELLENQSSPFCNLKWLKIEKYFWLGKSTIPSHAITYLRNGSPNSTIINECEKYFHDP